MDAQNLRSQQSNRLTIAWLIGPLGSVGIAAVSAWRLIAILDWSTPTGLNWRLGWLGLTLGFTLFWLGLLWLARRFKQTGLQWLTAAMGAIIFGLVGWLLTRPAGLSQLTLELTAENVWSPTSIEAVWSGDGLGQTRLSLPTHPPIPATLEITATGQPHPGGQNAAVFLLGAIWPDGQLIPLDTFQAPSGWKRQAVNWGSYQDQLGWVARGDQPATLRWSGMASGPLTLVFAKNPLSGQATIRWNGQLIAQLDLYTPLIAFQSVTLPTRETALWQAKLPLTALDQEPGLTLRPDPLNTFPAIYKKIRLLGLPGQPLEAGGHQLAEALRVEKGWLELADNGVQVKANDAAAPPQLFLTGPLTAGAWRARWLPWLENFLVVLYPVVCGGLLLAGLARHLKPAWLTNLNILAATLLITLLMGEMALRLYLPAANRYYVWEPNLHFVFNPNPELIGGIKDQTNVIINAQGMRGDDLTPESDYNILALGGSTTEALYLDQSEAWPQLLQDALNQNGAGLRVWVGNAGRSGRNTREHRLQAQHLLPQYPELDALMLLTGINDLGLRLEQGERYNPDYLNVPGARQVLMQRAFDAYPHDDPNTLPYYRRSAMWRLLDRARPAQATATTKIEVQNDDGSFIIERRQQRRQAEIRDRLPDLTTALAEYRRNLNQIIDLAGANDVRVILMTQPTLWRADLSEAEQNLLWFGWGPNFDYFYSIEALLEGIEAYNATLLDICQQRRVECIDLATILPQDTTVFYDDVHFNESGARQISAALAEYLLARPPFGVGQ